MEYKIEQIGAEFRNKDIQNLANKLNKNSNEGFEFHSVFQVQKPGCLGIGNPTITYLAVYTKK